MALFASRLREPSAKRKHEKVGRRRAKHGAAGMPPLEARGLRAALREAEQPTEQSLLTRSGNGWALHKGGQRDESCNLHCPTTRSVVEQTPNPSTPMSHYESLIDPAEFGLIADYLKSPRTPIHFVLYVRSLPELIRVAEGLDADQASRSILAGRLPPSVEQRLKEGSLLVSERTELGLGYQTIDPESIPRDTICQVLYYPPFYLVHAPGVFERVQTQETTAQSARLVEGDEQKVESPEPAQTMWFQPESFQRIGTLGGIEAFTLVPPLEVEIKPAEVGTVIEGNLVAARVLGREEYVMILDTGERYLAVPSEVQLRNDFATPVRVRVKGVSVEPHGQAARPAWEVHTRFALLEDVWLPASNQHLEQRTQPADRWVAEIQTQLLPGFHEALAREESRVRELQQEHRSLNPIAPRPLNATSAMLFTKALTYGPEYEAAYVTVHGQKEPPNSATYREAKGVYEQFEQRAELPEEKEHLRAASHALLSEDRRLHTAIAEHQRNVGVLTQSVSETDTLLRTLRGYGTTNVVMEQSTVRENRAQLLPVFIRAESLSQTVGQGRGVRK